MAKTFFAVRKTSKDDSLEDKNIELGNTIVVTTGQWDIEEADETIILLPENGGVIEEFATSQRERKHFGFLHSITWVQVILTVVVLFACFGGLIVLVADVLHGTMNFQIYMQYVVGFLAALGVGQFGKLLSKDGTK